MYFGLKNELIRTITNPAFKLAYTSTHVSKKILREQFTLHNNDKQILAIIKETLNHCRWSYFLTIGESVNYTAHIKNRDDIQSLYELCESRQQFEQSVENNIILNFLKAQHQK